MNGFWMLEIYDHSSLFGNQTPGVKDFRCAHDVCSGLGGFGTSVLAKSRITQRRCPRVIMTHNAKQSTLDAGAFGISDKAEGACEASTPRSSAWK